MSHTRYFFLKFLVCVHLINESHMEWHEGGKDGVSFLSLSLYFSCVPLCSILIVVVALDINV